jgi:hypothetical protein
VGNLSGNLAAAFLQPLVVHDTQLEAQRLRVSLQRDRWLLVQHEFKAGPVLPEQAMHQESRLGPRRRWVLFWVVGGREGGERGSGTRMEREGGREGRGLDCDRRGTSINVSTPY